MVGVMFSVTYGEGVFFGTETALGVEDDSGESAGKTDVNELFFFFFDFVFVSVFPLFRKTSLAPPPRVWFVVDRVVGIIVLETRPIRARRATVGRFVPVGRGGRRARNSAFARQRQGGGNTRAGPLYACGRRDSEGAYTGCVFSTSRSIFSEFYAFERWASPGVVYTVGGGG